MEPVYRHTQVSRATVAGAGLALVVAIWQGVRLSNPVLLTTAALAGCVLVLFSTLTVIVRDQTLEVCFGFGLIHRRIPLNRIREVQVVRTPWYYGWGIRLTPTGWLWNVSGLDGVEVQFDDGTRFRLGSDEPNQLAEALRRELSAVPPARG